MTERQRAPYPADTKAKGWRFELDLERIEQSDTWALTPVEIRPWLLMIWMTAWKQTPCGSLPAGDELIAAHIGMPIKTFVKCRASLMRGWWLADDGRLYHNTVTERVQAMLDSKNAEKTRKAEWRKRKAEGQTGNSPSVPDMSRGTTAGQPQDSQVTDDTGTGTGTGTSNSSSLRSEEKAAPQRGTRLSADWLLPTAWAEWAKTERPDLDPEKLGPKFRDYWAAVPGKAGVKLDWAATWRNFVRSERAAPLARTANDPGNRFAPAARAIFGTPQTQKDYVDV